MSICSISTICTASALLSLSIILLEPTQCQYVREHVRRDSPQAPMVAKNLFIESDALINCHDVQTRSQFYKTDSSLKRLFGCVTDRKLLKQEKKVVLVTGGAGFVGSHLVDSLMLEGHRVVVLDNYSTGRKSNIDHWTGHRDFKLVERDVAAADLSVGESKIDQIYHLASPASPVQYMANPMSTINTIVMGTMNILKLAQKMGARVVVASTSEIYGNPLVHPQREDYWGNTNPIGPRSCYDESKRLGETLTVTSRDQFNVSVGIARIFNTYGPRMDKNDGRVVSNFVTQAIQSKPMTVYGAGNQTRSFQYISDLVRGLKALMESNVSSPVNLGNPDEITILELSRQVRKIVPRSRSELVFVELPVDDPLRRRPDIGKAQESLGWQPEISLKSGLERTVDYFVQDLKS